jgi:hypothetical protein
VRGRGRARGLLTRVSPFADVAFLISDHLKAKRRGEAPRDILLSGLRGRTGAK